MYDHFYMAHGSRYDPSWRYLRPDAIQPEDMTTEQLRGLAPPTFNIGE
jgi:hypothetical protein